MNLSGFAQFERRLRGLSDNAVRRIAVPVVNAGLKELVKSVRDQVPAKYEDAKRLVGKRIDRSQTNEGRHQCVGKVGFAVGRIGGGKGGGKITARNIHWLVLGTKKRTTKAGANRGEMQAILAKCVEDGIAAASESAAAEMDRVFHELIVKQQF